jgi:hypothetical protein
MGILPKNSGKFTDFFSFTVYKLHDMNTVTKLFLIAFLGLSACANPVEKSLEGSWQGYELLEEGEALPLDPTEIRFEFAADKTYAFSGTLNYKEAGVYRAQSEYLFTTDTLRAGSAEKAVRLAEVSADTVVMEMMEENKMRVLKLRRFAEEPVHDENHPDN